MTDLKELIEREIDQYLEWPTADKSHVTTGSAKLFAEHVARLYAGHIPDAGKMVAPAVQGEPVSENITIERDLVGDIHIKVGDFDYVQVRYQYPYTDNASTRRLAEKISRLIAGHEIKESSDYPWHSLSSAMYQAAGAYGLPEAALDALSNAANGEPFGHLVERILPVVADPEQQVEQEPVAWQLRTPEGRVILNKEFPAWADGGDGYKITPLYAAPQPAEQQPSPDVSALVEALDGAARSLETISRLAGIDEYMRDFLEVRGYARNRALVAFEALAAHRKPGGEK